MTPGDIVDALKESSGVLAELQVVALVVEGEEVCVIIDGQPSMEVAEGLVVNVKIGKVGTCDIDPYEGSPGIMVIFP